MNKLIAVSLLSLSFGLSLLDSSLAFAKLKVVATLPSLGDIVTEIGGDEVSVMSLTKGTQDPHFVDAKPDLVLRLNRADLLIHAGLGLEDGWLPPLIVGARNGKIQTGSGGNLDASTLMELKEVPKGKLDRASGDVHPGGNPHFMLDPRNGIVFAKGIAKKLGELEPSKAAEFQKRAEDYSVKLKSKIVIWEKQLKPLLAGKPVVTYHKSWVYFTDWTGMNEVEHVEPKPGIPPSPEHVVRLIHTMRERKVKFILMEPFYPRGVAEDVAHQTGAKLLVLPTEVGGAPEAKTYADVFDQIVKDLQTAEKQAEK
jgi:zinc/manganese transport system substrate-binding protein